MSATAVGYRLVLPPGWIRIPLRDDPAAAVAKILDRSFSGLPNDSYGPFRHELEKRVMDHIAAARDNEGIDLYVPVERMHGVVVPASFLVALLEFDSVETPDVRDVLLGYAADTDGARVVDVDGSPAVRTESVVGPVQRAEHESALGSRRVSYLVAISEGRDQWLTVTFSTAGDGSPDGELAGLLVELFDAVMSTFRWTVER